MSKPNLSFPRKNTAVIHIKGCGFPLNAGDKIYFTVKDKPDNDPSDSKAVIKKSWIVGTDADIDSEGWLLLRLSAEETDKDAGEYAYDIKLVTSGDNPVSQTLVLGTLEKSPAITLEH